MKILQVINCFERSGGAEKFVLDLSQEQRRQGYVVEILSVTAPSENNREFIELAMTVGIKVHILGNRSVYSLKNLIKLRHFFSAHYYDVVNVHLFPAQYFCALAARRGMKLVFTEHSTDNRRRHLRLLALIDRWIYKRYERIICISEKVRKSLFDKVGVFPAVVIPNGIVFSDFYNAVPCHRDQIADNLPEGVKLVTMCARFCKEKDYLTLFHALEILPGNIHVVCIGGGVLMAEHQCYCQQNGLSRRVHFLGLRRDVNQIFKASDVIVLSSVYEGFSLSMLEAMASGKPFIASNVPGIVDLVEEYAVLFPFGDEKALAASILKLLRDHDYYESIVAKSLEFAGKYDIAATASRYVELYNSFWL